MTHYIPCNHCCYCRTGEVQYCLSPRQVKAPCEMPCNHCCYCRTGEVQYCQNPIKIVEREKSKK